MDGDRGVNRVLGLRGGLDVRNGIVHGFIRLFDLGSFHLRFAAHDGNLLLPKQFGHQGGFLVDHGKEDLSRAGWPPPPMLPV